MGTSKGKKAQGRHGTCLKLRSLWDVLGEDKRFRERKPGQKECIEEAGEAPRGSSGPWQLKQGDYNSSEKDTHVGTVHAQEKRLGVWLPELGNHLPGDRGMRRTFR